MPQRALSLARAPLRLDPADAAGEAALVLETNATATEIPVAGASRAGPRKPIA